MEQLKIFIGLITFLSIDETFAASHSCYIHGDPHFNTTDGDTYRFTGDVPCEYVLVDHRHFKVFGTFVACKTSCLNKVRIVFFSWTYILGPNDTVTAGATGKAPSISSIADLPYIRHVFQVEKADNGISVTFNIGVSVYWDKNKSATINFVDRWMNEATMFGMCGNFDGNPDNDWGVFDNAHDFGMSNMVADSCV